MIYGPRLAVVAGSLCVIVLASAAGISAAEQDDGVDAEKIQKRKPTRFVRVLRDEYREPVALQTATAKYVLKDAHGEVQLQVFLESAVHVGDRAYYRALNQRFKRYDVVLYELVAPPEKRVPDPEDNEAHPLRLFQQLAGDSLGLAHQIDEIDYKAQNMVHSDLSPAEMQAAMKKRGDDEITMLADAMLHLVRELNRAGASAGDDSEQPLDLTLLSDAEGATKLRRLLATTFDGAVTPEELLPPAHSASLIHDRNKRAMDGFQRQIDKGRRRIAFFWGAGHMRDLEKQLILGYGLQPAGLVWRNAWDLREGAVERAPLESILENTLRGALDDALRELLDSPQR